MTAYIRRFLFMAVCSVASHATALPTIQFVDNGNSSVTLQIVTDDVGVTASELSFLDGGVSASGSIQFTDAFIADPVSFDTPLPGNNPFTGGVTFGLYLDEIGDNRVFVSYGSAILNPGAYDFLTIEYTGGGTIQASGLVSTSSVLNDGLFASIRVPEPTAASLSLLSVLGLATRRRR